MIPKTGALRHFARSGARALAYSAPSRNLARKLVEDPSALRVREYLEKKGQGHKLRRLASQQLPEGAFFAKLTIKNWTKHRNKRFRLLKNGQLVYGNRIEAPSQGFELEYRNIVVTSEDPEDFSLDIDADYTLLIGKGAFTTAQQQRYDEMHGIEQHGDLFYALRGNTRSPKRALITFPGFGPSTSRISYAINHLQGLSDEDLADTVVICFQDRYLTAGTYMLADNAGTSLRARVHEEIARLIDRFGVPEESLLFFGASKGGSIATLYAEGFPKARIIAVAPEMNLPYYLDTPFFRDNLFRLGALRQEPQPGQLMRRYFSEGRRIDYLYADGDELSNYSLIEFVSDIPGLSKYRINGDRGDIANQAMPTVLCLLKQFVGGVADDEATDALGCDQTLVFTDEHSTGVQVRLSNSSQIRPNPLYNVILEGWLGRTRFLQLLTDHELPFIKYTAPSQRLWHDRHSTARMSSVLLTTSTGESRSGEFSPIALAGAPTAPGHVHPLWAELDLDPCDSVRTYSLLVGDEVGVSSFQYTTLAGEPSGDHVRVVFADTPRDERQVTSPDGWIGPRLIVTASSLGAKTGFAHFAHRIAVAAGSDSLHIVFEDPGIGDSELDATHLLHGPAVRCEDLRHTSV